MDAEKCMYCREIIPEGRMVCPNCEYRISKESRIAKVGALLQSRNATEEEVQKAYEWLYSDLDEIIDMC